MDQEKGRIVRRDVREGRSLQRPLVLDRAGGCIGVDHSAQKHRMRVPTAMVHKTAQRSPGDHALHFGAEAVDRALVLGIARAVQHAEHAHQVPAGGPADGADAVGVDAVPVRVVADKADGALRVLNRSGIVEARRGAVVDRKQRVAGLYQGHALDLDVWATFERPGVQAEWGAPAAPRNVDDAITVGRARTIDVQQQRQARDHAVYDVGLYVHCILPTAVLVILLLLSPKTGWPDPCLTVPATRRSARRAPRRPAAPPPTPPCPPPDPGPC